MAIYHFSAKVISRARGSSAVAAAAYRSASRLHDERLDRDHDFSNKADVIHSEVMLPEGVPERWHDRATLWNAVEAHERRKDAQLAREVEFAIPCEMRDGDGIALARDFVQRTFVEKGMVADLNVHWDVAEDGNPKPHAHVMLTMREIVEGEAGAVGFGAKAREWNATALLEQWREDWSTHVNARLAELGIDAAVDHRTLEAQGIALEPQHKIGPAGSRRFERAEDAERAEDHRRIARENGARIIAQPSTGLDAITYGQSTFTVRDMARFAHRHSDGQEQFGRVLSAMRQSPDLIALGRDGKGEERFTSRDMLAVEQRLERAADRLAGRSGHRLSTTSLTAGSDGLELGTQQQAAVRHIGGEGDLTIVVGYAGTGKSAMLSVARERWEAEGYSVRGAALSGIAAENLESGSGIGSRTIASLELGWARGREILTRNDILVVDEAGMVGSHQMERLLSAADTAGAKVVLVGDAEQLQAIEAGAAFRHLSERYGAAEINTIRRQHEPWQREATRSLATGRTGEAVAAYAQAGMVSEHADRDMARDQLIEGWMATRSAEPQARQLILAHTRADVASLNDGVRERLKADGALADEVVVQTSRGPRGMAPGDQIMFLSNERDLGVKNGTTGEVIDASRNRLLVKVEDAAGPREVRFDLKDYADIDHGYAATIHKSQGVTVDHVHILATPGLDRHASYVGLSRHRDTVRLHYGRDDFDDRRKLVRTLSRERAKDVTLDYGGDDGEVAKRFAQRRELGQGADGAAGQPNHVRAIQDFAKAFEQARDAERRGGTLPAALRQALGASFQRIEQMREHGGVDLAQAFARDEAALRGALNGDAGAALAGMAREANVRQDPELRAARFEQSWRGLYDRRQALEEVGADSSAVNKALATMRQELKGDPALAAALQARQVPEREMTQADRVLRIEVRRSRDRGMER
ncbi:Ti-type conjugative transfer relaxase TraA [Rhizorhabdus argentea]|uniref:Ti-type conjugative transfer relaxase TraA n=1 Tax=Rhizorhabdus argentea TaxID=1387174 RepID=UPI0030EC9F85